MSEAILWKIRLTEEQRKAIDSAMRNLLLTVLKVMAEMNLPTKDMERIMFTETMLSVIGHLAQWVSEAVSEADLELARRLGLEPSP